MSILMIILDVDECEVFSPCRHNATCLNNNGSYQCDCVDGWQDQHCDRGKAQIVARNFCQAKAHCQRNVIIRYMCATVYVVDVNECDFAPCNNNGTCINNNGSYVCECIDGWKGQHCEDGKIQNCIF